MTRITRLVTHSGAFHADDLFAHALLAHLHPEAQLLRTRDEAILGATGTDTVIFDVGDIHDPRCCALIITSRGARPVRTGCHFLPSALSGSISASLHQQSPAGHLKRGGERHPQTP